MEVTLSSPLARLLEHCNDQCYPDCCLDGAFTIDDNTVGNWLSSHHSNFQSEIAAEVKALIEGLAANENDVTIMNSRLASTWQARNALEFFEELEVTFFNVVCDQGG